MKEIKRCKWCNTNNPLYIQYHDKEWGRCNDLSDRYLFEMLILESFQAGLSWECVLNKREQFRIAYDHFDVYKVSHYDELKIQSLLENKHIIRNKLKIKASILNAKIFLEIVSEYHSFYNYLNTFIKDQILYENNTTNALSDTISNDLKRRGMKFTGSTTIYAYLQSIGIISSHEKACFLYKER